MSPDSCLAAGFPQVRQESRVHCLLAYLVGRHIGEDCNYALHRSHYIGGLLLEHWPRWLKAPPSSQFSVFPQSWWSRAGVYKLQDWERRQLSIAGVQEHLAQAVGLCWQQLHSNLNECQAKGQQVHDWA